jgi:hypothetical protein
VSQLESLAHEQQQEKNERNMKKTSSRRRRGRDEMRGEYQFDYASHDQTVLPPS